MPSHSMTSRLHPINNDKTIQLNFSGTALGFDFGLKRIGVASGEQSGRFLQQALWPCSCSQSEQDSMTVESVDHERLDAFHLSSDYDARRFAELK